MAGFLHQNGERKNPLALHRCKCGPSAGEAHIWHNPGMNPRDPVAELLGTISRVLPRLPADVEHNLRAALSGVFHRLDLVTREEFDVQREVLARTRAKLAELEAKLAELEGRQKAEGNRQKGE